MDVVGRLEVAGQTATPDLLHLLEHVPQEVYLAQDVDLGECARRRPHRRGLVPAQRVRDLAQRLPTPPHVLREHVKRVVGAGIAMFGSTFVFMSFIA